MNEFAMGVVGIGRMGLPIASRLRDAGLRVSVTDRNPALAEPARAAGLNWVGDLAELASGSETVLTVLPGPGEVRELIDPLLTHVRPGSAWVDMTSAVPAVASEIRARAAGRVRILECPVGGDPERARAGSLLGYVGAEPEDLGPMRRLLDALCRELVHIGPPGTGYAVKLLVNALWFGQAIAVAETLALGQRLGLDASELHRTLTRGPAAHAVKDVGDSLLRGDDMPTFPLARCLEEIDGVLDLAEGAELPVTDRVAEIYRRALDHHGDADGELLAARYLSEQLGVRFS